MKVCKKKFAVKKQLKSTKGITLIALVITIIVLLILAGVSLSMVLNQDGIFSRAEKSANKYKQAKARETLELLLSDAQMQKYEEGLTEEQLDRKIQEIGELLPKEDPNPTIQDVIVEGYIFKVDKNVPKIIEFVDRADGIIITAVLSNNATDGWLSASESDVNIKGKIMTYSGGKITTVRAKSGETPISGFSINKDGLYEINHITESSIITIEAEDSKGKKKNKEINVEVKIDKTAPTVETVNAAVEGRKIKLSATGHDKAPNGEEQSGIKEFNYTITPADGVDKVSGTFSKNGTAEINVTNWTLYTIKVTATDTGSGLKELRYTVSPETISPSSGVLTGNPVELTATELREYTITFTALDNAGNQATPVTIKATASDMISIEEAKKITTETLPDYIGKKVDYRPTAGETWRVFYYDEHGEFGTNNTVYLKRDYGGASLGGYSVTENGLEMMKNLNPMWKNYGTNASKTVTNSFTPNVTASMAMCDTDKWNEYAVGHPNLTTKYAIGAPSIEMWTKAYNIYVEKYEPSNNKISCTILNSSGYGWGTEGGNISTRVNINLDTSKEASQVFGTASWQKIASPSADGTSNVCQVNYTQIYSDSIISGERSCCPVVAL